MKTRYFKLSELNVKVFANNREKGNHNKNIKSISKAIVDEWGGDADITFKCPEFSKISAYKGIFFEVLFSDGQTANLWLEETWVY